MTVSLPGPRDFRGDDATASMVLGSFAFTNRGVYTPKPIWEAGSLALVIVFLASLVAIWAYRRYARKQLFEQGKLLPVLWPSLQLNWRP